MKKIFILPLSLLMLLSITSIFACEYYSPPYCFENNTDDKNSPDPNFAALSRQIEGTCKVISYDKFYVIDDSIKSKYFFYYLSYYAGPGDDINTSNDYFATSSNMVSFDPPAGSGNILLLENGSRPFERCGVSDAAFFGNEGVSMRNENIDSYESCLDNQNKNGSIYVDQIFYYDYPASKYGTSTQYQKCMGLYTTVPNASPITGRKEYWTIKEAPISGILYKYKSKIDTYFEDGTTGTEIFEDNYQKSVAISSDVAANNSTSTATTDVQTEQKSFWVSVLSAISTFFKNIF